MYPVIQKMDIGFDDLTIQGFRGFLEPLPFLFCTPQCEGLQGTSK